MAEIGIDIARHKPITFEELDELEGLNFDLVVTLSPPAHHKALELTRTVAAEVEYWPTVDPTVVEGNREQRLEAYRQVRDQLMARIRERFGRRAGAMSSLSFRDRAESRPGIQGPSARVSLRIRVAPSARPGMTRVARLGCQRHLPLASAPIFTAFPAALNP